MHTQRTETGISIVEMLVGSLILTIVVTAVLGFMCTNTREASGFYNKSDVITSATDALNRIGLLTRSARGFGENYGQMQVDITPSHDFTVLLAGGTNKQNGINTQTSAGGLLSGGSWTLEPWFPAAGDPYYCNSGGGATCPASVYGGTWPWSGISQVPSPPGPAAPPAPGQYIMAQDCMILQVPVFVDSAGFDPTDPADPAPHTTPYIWPATWDGLVTPTGLAPMQAVDTYVFRVIPDKTAGAAANTFMLQQACFPANPAGQPVPVAHTPANFTGHPTNSNFSLKTPLTLVAGIVGPLDNSGQISVFNYIEKVNNTATVNPPAAGLYISDYTGVLISLEILKQGEGSKASVASFRTGFYVRNNAVTHMEGT